MSNVEIKIVDVDIDDIKPYWRNPRKSKDTVPALMKSIERFGFNVPLVLDNANTIVAGHTRYRALQKLGWKKVPCVYTNKGQKELREYRVLDNKVQELTNWDEEELLKEMNRIFNGSDLAEYFEDSLDRVINMEELDVSSVDIDFSAVTEEQTLNEVSAKENADDAMVPEDAEEWVARCPFCETQLTKDDVVEE